MAAGREQPLDFESLAQKALDNIEKDRAETKQLLQDLKAYVANGSDRHSKNSLALAKYVETLQRSNEQIVKLATVIKRASRREEETLSEEDREAIFAEMGS